MVKLARSTLLLAGTVLLAACQTESAEQTGATEEAAVTDAASVRSEIEAANDGFEQALLAQDAATLATFYTEDAVALPPGAARAEGRAAIESMFADWFGQMTPSETFTLTTDDFVLSESGDIAYEVGTYRTAGSGPEGQAYDITGKYLAAWENEDGEWKIAADSWSDDAPMHMGEEPGDAAAPAGEAPAADPAIDQPAPAETES